MHKYAQERAQELHKLISWGQSDGLIFMSGFILHPVISIAFHMRILNGFKEQMDKDTLPKTKINHFHR